MFRGAEPMQKKSPGAIAHPGVLFFGKELLTGGTRGGSVFLGQEDRGQRPVPFRDDVELPAQAVHRHESGVFE